MWLCNVVCKWYIAKQFVTNESRGRINGRPLVSCESNVSAAICIFLQLCTCSVKSVHQMVNAIQSAHSTEHTLAVPIIDQFERNAKDVGYITQPLIYEYVCDRIRFLTRLVE